MLRCRLRCVCWWCGLCCFGGFAEAADVVEIDERGGGVAARVGLGEVAGERIHLLAELGVAADGFAPLAHHVVERVLLAVVGHPAWSTEVGEGLRCSAPTVAWDGTDEGGVVERDAWQRVGRPEGFGVVDL